MFDLKVKPAVQRDNEDDLAKKLMEECYEVLKKEKMKLPREDKGYSKYTCKKD